MVKKHQSFILFASGLLLGALLYGLLNYFSFSARTAYTTDKNSRNIANITWTRIQNHCPQLRDLTQDNINAISSNGLFCTINTSKEDHGVRYKVRSQIKVTKGTGNNQNKLHISVTSSIKEKTEHITEAEYCSGCSETAVVTIDDDVTNISQVLNNNILSILTIEEDRIEEAIEEAYEDYQDKQELEEKIAQCKVSPRSTSVRRPREISGEELIECRKDQIDDITNARDRTLFFHSTIKPDLWSLAQEEDPLERSFFLSDYMRELNSPSVFTHDYFSIRSAMDTIEKYSDLRRHISELGGAQSSIALNNIRANLPLYFYTNENTHAGRQDRRFLESAWNKNFSEQPFPTYYSISSRQNNSSRRRSNNARMSANQFRAIVDSNDFRKLYQ